MTKYFKRSALPLRNNRGTPSRFLSAGPLVLFFSWDDSAPFPGALFL